MSYQVLARKYRSATFDDLVGQGAIARTLKNAVATDRVHHGYLFTGTRGVGKTSTARILAKALNCLSSDAPIPTPCCACDSCKAIAEGEDLDVVEIDAASNTGVDNIRELRSNATLRPARSRFKIYIIDEVHMLSTGAFNALLKTLEEPPDHVKFILATTELQKVPATIQSRCQRFSFRAVSPDDIAGHLRAILEAESIRAEDAVVRRIARLANGSIRDALSLMDMVLSYGAQDLTAVMLEEILPPAHDDRLFELMGRIAEGDAAGALHLLDEGLGGGQTVPRLCDGLIQYMRTLMLVRICGDDTELVDVPEQVRPRVAQQAAAFAPQTYVYMISLVEELRRGAKYGGAGRALADATIVRLAMSGRFTDIAALLSHAADAAPPARSPSVEEKKNAPAEVSPRSPQPAERRDLGAVPRVVAEGSSPADGVVSAERRRDGTRETVASDGTAGRGMNPEHPAPVAPGAPVVAVEPVAPVAPGANRSRMDRSGTGGISTAQRQRVMADPLVKRALELVDGTLVAVRRRTDMIPQGSESAPETDAAGTEPPAPHTQET